MAKQKQAAIEETQDDEAAVVHMQRVHSSSRPNRIASLEVGQSEAEAVRLAFDGTTKEIFETELDRVKSTMSRAMANAAERSGNKYVMEAGSFMTRSRDFIITCVVTRVE